jgi:hypothetical protein
VHWNGEVGLVFTSVLARAVDEFARREFDIEASDHRFDCIVDVFDDG